jgi:membrane protein involved in colicin uptake
MKSIVKKVAIFSMIGMMQIGLGTSVIEAAQLYNETPSAQQQDNRHNRDHNRHERERRENERHRRERIENERHERAMERRHHESYREWRERQRHENRRHAENMRRIAHDILHLIFDR